MAKRKKRHKHSKYTKKLRKQNSSVVKNTTNGNKPSTISKIEAKEPKKIENTPVTNTQNKLVISDVRFSLLLLGIIIMAFIAIALLMSNLGVANSVYGFIKINN